MSTEKLLAASFAFFDDDDDVPASDDASVTPAPSFSAPSAEQVKEIVSAARKNYLSGFSAQESLTTHPACVWPETPPVFLGNLSVCALGIGGGRGYVATADLRPGELVLSERPLVRWTESYRFDTPDNALEGADFKHLWVCLLSILACKDRATVLRQLAKLHPFSLADLAPSDMAYLFGLFEEKVTHLLSLTEANVRR